MRNRLTVLANSIVAFPAAAFVTLSATPTPAQQQSNPVYVPPVLERRESDLARQRDMKQSEILRQRLGRRPERLANPMYVQAIIAQVKQDFERIQVARNGIVRAAASGNNLDYKFISEVAGEIKKRASRLEDNLALPEPEGDKKSRKTGIDFDEMEMKTALMMLCDRIESFVKSPIFETPGVLDVQHSTKASSDLESILKLSASVRKSAERLKIQQLGP
jgi:hypothetical protein